MVFTDKWLELTLLLSEKLYHIQHFQPQCLKLYKRPNRKGHLNSQHSTRHLNSH
jgi:hypothetical protein